MKTILASLFLLLALISTLAYADDNAFIIEANNALAHKDYLTAFSKLSILAQHGNADAQYNVGSLYFNGMGVKNDFKQAFEWYHKAALQGKAKAQYILGLMYQNGLGVQQDNKQSIDWYKKAATQGSESALQAIKREAALGNENAKSALGILQPQPTPAATLPQAALAVALSQARPQPLAQAHPQSVIDNKKIGLSPDQTNKTAPGANYGQQQSGQSAPSNFSLGVNLGQIGKLTGISNSSSIGLLAGYKFNSSYGIELSYNSLYRNANASTLASTISPGATGAFDMNSFSLAGQYTYPLSSDFSLLGNLGLHSSSYNLKISGNTLKSGSTNGMVAGLKVQYDFGKNIGIRGGFDTYSESGAIKGTLTEIGVSAIFKF